jgi:hypothetical protein
MRGGEKKNMMPLSYDRNTKKTLLSFRKGEEEKKKRSVTPLLS